MSDMKKLITLVESGVLPDDTIDLHDSFDIEINEHFVIETGVIGFTDDGIILEADDTILGLLEVHDILIESEEVIEEDTLPGTHGDWIHGGFKIRYSPETRTVRIMGKNQERGHTFKNPPNATTYRTVIAKIIDQLEDESSMYETTEDDLDQDIDQMKKRAGIQPIQPIQPKVPQQSSKGTPISQMNPIDRYQWERDKKARGLSYDTRIDSVTPDTDMNTVFREEEISGEISFGRPSGPIRVNGRIIQPNDPSYNQYASKLSSADKKIGGFDTSNLSQGELQALEKWKRHMQTNEAEYQGRKVPLGKPMKGDVKKSKVYVRKPNGKVVKVNFGDKNMKIKKSNPKRRKSFRARHRCENPGPRWKARYWSCKAW